jgi:hypothetical protein
MQPLHSNILSPTQQSQSNTQPISPGVSVPVAPASLLGIDLPPFTRPKIENILSNELESCLNSSQISVNVRGLMKAVHFWEPHQVPTEMEDSYISVLVIKNGILLIGFLRFDEVTNTLGVSRELLLKACNGNLRYLFALLKDISPYQSIEHEYSKMMLNVCAETCYQVAVTHKRLEKTAFMNHDSFKTCLSWFQVNHRLLEDRLSLETAKNPHSKCVVLKREETRLPFNIEFRLDSNRIRVIRDLFIGSSNKLSLHVDLDKGLLFLKSKRKITQVPKAGIEIERYVKPEMVISEASSITRLRNSPGFVHYLFAPEIGSKKDEDSLNTDYKFYTFTEFLRGKEVLSVINEDRPEGRKKLIMFFAMCQSVLAMHKRGVVHRDLKLENFISYIVSPEMPIQFLKCIDPEYAVETNSLANPGFGTLRYIDPYCLFLTRMGVISTPALESADVYSLGVILYILIIHRFPILSQYLKNKQYDILHKENENVKSYNVQKLDELNELSMIQLMHYKIPPQFIDLARSMLSPVPEKRMSLEKVIETLQIIMQGQ